MALTDEAIGRIKDMVISGSVRPGQKLPREADLAGELGLSRNSPRGGQGAQTLLLEVLGLVVDLLRDDAVLELLEVRRILEPTATG